MIDIHCHILPGLDDGSKSLPQTLKMAEQAVEEGITHIIATPHHKNGTYINKAEDIQGVVAFVNGKLRHEQIPLTILPGQETRIYGEMVQDLKSGELLPLNATSNYIFIELPDDHVPQYITQLQFEVQIAGYQPIIVHPERNEMIRTNPDLLHQLVSNGALTQVTAASVAGKRGRKLQKFTHQLIGAQLTHFVASDAHDPKKRTYYLKDAYRVMEKQFGAGKVYQLQQNSKAIVDDLSITVDTPSRIKGRKIIRT
ncbi:protein-tyrosine phosphatase [Virgibacillus natechei]|uniref:Tyrosine-protein phosphatase n=1 Tax=Virgibacillus natechei TaxID=1216297 RepID=A0ABS4IFS9_9BACI|nr:CpsB/CapC family capsule biosynthesis tyrosine phosphatase [Virgibacillus natechei]MBP1969201.1 protein-tyrosine phosphatase [Virgibacillus natechei]UZD12366.1 tyrosine protein phosphatase [Virgibacillus natechei]